MGTSGMKPQVYRAIGINIVVGDTSTTRAAPVKGNDTIMLTGIAERGPVNEPVSCRSFRDYTLRFGEYRAGGQLYQAMDIIYNAYASRVVDKPEVAVVRVVGPGATKASVILKDTNGVNTLKVEAKDPNRIPYFVKVIDGTNKRTVYDPELLPQLVGASTGGTVPDGTYEVRYTYVNGNGETLQSSSSAIVISDGTSTSKITLTVPVNDDELPFGIDGIQAYVKVSDNWRKAGSATTGGVNTVDITAIPDSGDDEAPTTNTATLDTYNFMLYQNSDHIFGVDDMTLSDADISAFNKMQDRVNLINQDSTSPFNERNPAVMTNKVALVGGDDDLANVDESVVVGSIAADGTKTGLKAFDNPRYEFGTMATPGFSSSAIHEELERQCAIAQRTAYIDMPFDTTEDELITWRTTSNIDSRHLALAWPCSRTWLNVDKRKIGGYRQWVSTSIDMVGTLWAAEHGPEGIGTTNAGHRGRLSMCPGQDTANGLIGGLYKDIYGNDLVRDRKHATDIGSNYQVIAIMNRRSDGPTIWNNVMLTTSQLLYNEIHRTRGIARLYYAIRDNFESREGVTFENLHGGNIKRYEETVIEVARQQCEVFRKMGILTGVSNETLTDDPSTAYDIKCGPEYNSKDSLDRGEFYLYIQVRMAPVIKFFLAYIEGRSLTDEF